MRWFVRILSLLGQGERARDYPKSLEKWNNHEDLAFGAHPLGYSAASW